MQSLVNLFNQSLTSIGQGRLVTDPNESTKEAATCRLWFPVALAGVLSAAHWSSVRAITRPALLVTRDTSRAWQEGDPMPGYLYTYALPAACHRPQHLHDFSRFVLGRHGDSRAIFANSAAPILYYTKLEENPALWEGDLYQAVMHALAASLNMAKTGKAQLTQYLSDKAQFYIAQNGTNAANEDDEYFDAIPSLWNGTGLSIPNPQTQFFYPTQTFAVGGVA